jgi:hypothetical protein
MKEAGRKSAVLLAARTLEAGPGDPVARSD